MPRVCLVAAACAALPDIDYLGWPVAHRSITHSIAFALAGALVATAMFFRSAEWREHRARVAVILGLAFLSHGLLDGLSTYSYGVEYFAPFSPHRFRLWWTPLGDPEGRLTKQFIQEALVVLSRHGKPDWDYRTPIPGRAFAEWRRGEDDAPLDPVSRPGSALEQRVRTASCVITSPLRRSLESARLLAPASVPFTDALFREADLPCGFSSAARLRPDAAERRS